MVRNKLLANPLLAACSILKKKGGQASVDSFIKIMYRSGEIFVYVRIVLLPLKIISGDEVFYPLLYCLEVRLQTRKQNNKTQVSKQPTEKRRILVSIIIIEDHFQLSNHKKP